MTILAGLSHSVTYVAPSQVIAASPESVSMVFGGDMMFDRTVRQVMEIKSDDFIFSCIDDVLHNDDITVANLEGPITEHASISVGSLPGDGSNFTFTFATSTAMLLARHHITVVNLGNNHVVNFGTSGVRSTISLLREAGVDYFGDPIAHRVTTYAMHGVNIALIAYNEFDSGGASNAASTTRADILYQKAAGYMPIVYAHWGVEYATTSPSYVRERAHSFVDAGAMLVIGSHPHVVEDHELYRGIPIYYSLGNFIFDQYWNDAVRNGLLVSVLLNRRGVASVREIPIQLEHDRRTCMKK